MRLWVSWLNSANNFMGGSNQKFPLAVARKVGDRLIEALAPACSRLAVAGSIRREKAEVGDVEIVYIPKTATVPNPEALFGDESMQVNAVDLVLKQLIEQGSLAKRTNVLGSEVWGAKNKFAVAVKTGIPVDFFEATPVNWFNYLVCRTGGALMNTEIAKRAKAKGFKWNPYGSGFTKVWGTGEAKYVVINSEEEVFHFVGLPYLEPRERC